MSNLDALIRFLVELQSLLLDNDKTGLGLKHAPITFDTKPIDIVAFPCAVITPMLTPTSGGLAACEIAVFVFDHDAGQANAALDILRLAGNVADVIERYKGELPGSISDSAAFSPGRVDFNKPVKQDDGNDAIPGVIYTPITFTVRLRQ